MIELKDICKSYGGVYALDHLNLSVPEGQLFGIVGEHGAGKTTLFRILAGLVQPEEGEFTVAGIAALRDPGLLKKTIAYVPAGFGLYEDLSVMEHMEFFASIYGLTGESARRRGASLLEFVHLEEQAEWMPEALTNDMKRRLCLARCLIHDPGVLLLDDFLSGMNPRARQELKELLWQLRSEGKTILFSSGVFGDVAEPDTMLGIMQAGRLVLRGTLQEITEQVNEANPLELLVADRRGDAVAVLKASPVISNISMEEGRIIAGFTGTQEDQVQLLWEIVGRGVPVISFQRRKSDLESVFLRLTQDQ